MGFIVNSGQFYKYLYEPKEKKQNIETFKQLEGAHLAVEPGKYIGRNSQ